MASLSSANSVFFQRKLDDATKCYENWPIIPISESDLQYPYQEMNDDAKENIKLLQECYEEKSCLYKKLTASFNLKCETEPRIALDRLLKNQEDLGKETNKILDTISHKKQQLETFERGKKQSKDEIPKIRREYDFLIGTFAIKWDEIAPENEVKGCILRRSSADVIPFSIDTDANSSYFLTNFLWKQLGNPDSFLQ